MRARALTNMQFLIQFFQQFYNSESTTERPLFNKKNVGGIDTDTVFEFGRSTSVGVFIKDKDDTFKVTYTPWDPDNRDEFPDSEWKFECFDDDATLNAFPKQMCGNNG